MKRVGTVDTNRSLKEIRKIASAARNGDADAMKELRLINQRMVNNTVRRLKKLDQDKTIVSPAASRIKNAMGTLSKGYLSKSKKLDVDELMEQIMEMRSFLTNVTSTPKGAKIYSEKYKQAMKDKFGIDLKNEKDVELWRQFTQTAMFDEMVEYDSEKTLLEGWKALQQGKTIEELEESFKAYKNRSRSLLQSWRDWTKLE